MPAWLQGVLALAGLVVVVSQIIARWGGRAQRQDTDGRVLDDAARAVQRHDVTDATMSSTLSTIARGVERMEARLDRLAEGHAETREARVRSDGEMARLRDELTRLRAQYEAQAAQLADIDRRQDAARHALRGEIQGWVTSGVERVIELLTKIAAGK